MKMAVNPTGMIARGLRLARKLCTSAEAAPLEAARSKRLYQRLSALGSTDGSVSDTLDEYTKEGKKLSKMALVSCLKELRKYGKFDHSLQILEWMENRNMNLSYADYAMRTHLLARVRGIAAAENYFHGLLPSEKNESTYGALLYCYCRELLTEKALALFEQMRELKLLSRSLPFNNLMGLYLKLKQPEKALDMVHQMKQMGTSPCFRSCNLWLQSYGHLGDFDGVDRVLDELKKDGELPVNLSWTLYSNLADIYIKAGFFEKAESALKMLEKNISRPDREAYHFLISLYAGTNNRGEVHRVSNSLKAGFNMTNMSYLVILLALAKLKDVAGVTYCFNEWKSNCKSYDVRLAEAAIKAYLDQDMYEEATQIFNEAQNRCAGPLSFVRELFMQYLLKIRQLDSALEHLKAVLSEGKENAWKPHQKTVSAFFSYFEEEKDVDGAEKFCKILKVIGSLDSKAYHLLLKTYIAADRLAPEIRQRLEEDNIQITGELESLLSEGVQSAT